MKGNVTRARTVEEMRTGIFQGGTDLVDMAVGTAEDLSTAISRAGDYLIDVTREKGVPARYGSPMVVRVETLEDMRLGVYTAGNYLNQKARVMELHDGVGSPTIWYRGCARESYQLVPSLFRYVNGPKVETLLYEQYMAFTGRRRRKREYWDALYNMQHYFVPTRLLDWTTDLEVAFFFALSDDDCQCPSVFVLQPNMLNNLSPGVPRPLRLGSSKYIYPNDYKFPGTIQHFLPLAAEPDVINARIDRQSSTFTVHGKTILPLDDLCPQVLVKVVLDNANFPSYKQTLIPKLRTAWHIFPDKTGLAKTLLQEYGLKPFPANRIQQILSEIWKHDSEWLRNGGEEGPYQPGIAGAAVGHEYVKRPYEEDELEKWLGPLSDTHLAIICGGAGCGKTNLLVDLADKFSVAEGGRRSVLFFSLGGFSPREGSLLHSMADFLRSVAAKMPHIGEDISAAALAEMIRNGKILLILDGVDELVRTKGEQSLDTLKDEISRLTIDNGPKTRHGAVPKVIIACRDHILNRLKRKRISAADIEDNSRDGIDDKDKDALFESVKEILLKPLDMVQLKKTATLCAVARIIENAPDVFQIVSTVPLFLSVLSRASKTTGTAATTVDGITTKLTLWDTWMQIANGIAGLNDKDSLVRRLGTVAVKMLIQRDDYVGEKDLETEEANLVHRLSLSSVTDTACPIFVRELDNKFRFLHQNIREYVLAWSMYDALRSRREDSLLIKTSSLDYESAETFMYLRDILNNNRDDSTFVLEPIVRGFSLDIAREWT
ncbi:MAG: FRG domain-containing protein, partial [Capsulimonadaceae bacterium]